MRSLADSSPAPKMLSRPTGDRSRTLWSMRSRLPSALSTATAAAEGALSGLELAAPAAAPAPAPEAVEVLIKKEYKKEGGYGLRLFCQYLRALGHVPMLADPEFASLMHAIGVASLGASKRDLWHLTKVYWYTVEFGLVREADRSLKAFGAGVLSSYGELEYSLSKEPEIRELDPFLVMPKIDYCGGFQDTYFFLNSFEEGRAALLEFAQFMKRPGVQEVELPDVAVHGTQPDDRAYTPLPT